MSDDVNQGRIISNLNAYLKAQNFPFSFDDDGICNGLVALHLQYALKGEAQKFHNILKFIADGKKVDNITNDDIDVFVIKVAATFDPLQFNFKLRQSNSFEMLSINGHELKSSFDLCLVAKDADWEQIFKELDIRDNEVVKVSSKNHTISIQKNNGKYIVYDPNYSEGYQVFDNEKKLIKELHGGIFYYRGKNMGLELHVIRNPEDDSPRVFPDIIDIYNRFLVDVNATAHVWGTWGKDFSTLGSAASINDHGIVQYLLDKGATSVYEAAGNAVINNNPATLSSLLEKITATNEMYVLFIVALESGRKEAFDALLQNERYKKFYEDIFIIQNTNNKWQIKDIIFAAGSGNPELLGACINNHVKKLTEYAMKTAQENHMCPEDPKEKSQLESTFKNSFIEEITKSIIAHKGMDDDPIMKAVQSGSKATVDILLIQLEQNGYQLEDTDKMRYLAEAIRHNHFHLSSYLIRQKPTISSELLNTLSMSTLAVERTNTTLLLLLKNNGMIFSESAQNIIDRKNKRSLTIIESLGIAVEKFTDFFKDNLSNRAEKGIHYNCKMFKPLKEMAQKVKIKEEYPNLDDLPKVETLELEDDALSISPPNPYSKE